MENLHTTTCVSTSKGHACMFCFKRNTVDGTISSDQLLSN